MIFLQIFFNFLFFENKIVLFDFKFKKIESLEEKVVLNIQFVCYNMGCTASTDVKRVQNNQQLNGNLFIKEDNQLLLNEQNKENRGKSWSKLLNV